MYLVRWPGLVAALVTAADEDDLIDILDETANPEGCTWSVYRGPVYVEFSLNAEVEIREPEPKAREPRERPLEPSEIRLGDVDRIREREVMTPYVPGAETADRMIDAITKRAFPALHRVLHPYRESLPEKEIRAALRDELAVLVQASWQHQQTKRRPDQDSRIAAAMGTSPRLVAHWAKRAAGAEARRTPPPPKKPPNKKPPSPSKPKRSK
jgi:hypothetical protein